MGYRLRACPISSCAMAAAATADSRDGADVHHSAYRLPRNCLLSANDAMKSANAMLGTTESCTVMIYVLIAEILSARGYKTISTHANSLNIVRAYTWARSRSSAATVPT